MSNITINNVPVDGAHFVGTITINNNFGGTLTVDNVITSSISNNYNVTIVTPNSVVSYGEFAPIDDVVTRLAWNVLYHHCFMPRLSIIPLKTSCSDFIDPASLLFSYKKSIIGIKAKDTQQTFYFDSLVRKIIVSFLQPKFLQKNNLKA